MANRPTGMLCCGLPLPHTHTCTKTAGLLRSMLALTRQLMAKKWTWTLLNGIHTWPIHAHSGSYTPTQMHRHTHTHTYRSTYTRDNMRIRINKFARTKLQHFGISNRSCVYISMHTSMSVYAVCVCVSEWGVCASKLATAVLSEGHLYSWGQLYREVSANKSRILNLTWQFWRIWELQLS